MKKKRNPILRKAMDLLAHSITPISKVRKPKSFTLLKHYSYAYVGEYEFSPSSTPLFQHCRKVPVKKRSLQFFCFLCGGGAGSTDSGALDSFSLTADAVDFESPEPLELAGEDDEDSVDTRAEKFIEMFYKEMRIQRQQSLSALF